MTPVRVVRGSGRKYFVSRNGNIYHARSVFPRGDEMLLRAGAIPLAPDYKGRKGRARVELVCPRRRKRWHPDVLWLVARAWGYAHGRGAVSPMRTGAIEFFPRNGRPFDFRAENVDFRETQNPLLRRKRGEAGKRFEAIAEHKWKRAAAAGPKSRRAERG